MKADFDNLDDVIGKFAGTICLYDKKPVIVKSALNGEHPGEFTLNIYTQGASRGKQINLHDPAFSYRDFSLGYANQDAVALWWYRRPLKQYQQGLKGDQLGWCTTLAPHSFALHYSFSLKKPFTDMLENIYPHNTEVEKALIDQQAKVRAFHRDFAVSWDNLHEDCVLEYRGKKVGVSTRRGLTEFRLISEFKHLNEKLKEAVAGV